MGPVGRSVNLKCICMRRFAEYTSNKHNISIALDPNEMLK